MTTLDQVESTHFDTVVIGFGKAGKTLAMGLANAGRSVALIEESPAMYGGTCINIGCVPTKTLLHDADLHSAVAPGSATGPDDYSSAMERKKALRKKMNAANLAMVEKPGAVVIDGRAEFLGERRIKVTAGTDELEVTGENVIINTGATPRVPTIDGLPDNPVEDPRVLFSTELIDRDALPRRMAVLGAGFIGLELANMYAKFGSEVTVLNGKDRLVPHEDSEASEAIEEVLTQNGVRFLFGTSLTSVDAPQSTEAPLTLNLDVDGEAQALEVDALLISIGRVPRTEGLGLEAAGVETGPRGVVDDFLRTSAKNVWAVGDVNGGPQFTFVSYDDHRIVKDQLLAGKGETGRSLANRGPVPNCTFLTPPFARVGLSEKDARQKAKEEGWDVAVARAKVADIAVMPRPKAVAEARGYLQVVVDRKTEQIGCHVVLHRCPGSDQHGDPRHEAPVALHRIARRDLHPPVDDRRVQRSAPADLTCRRRRGPAPRTERANGVFGGKPAIGWRFPAA